MPQKLTKENLVKILSLFEKNMAEKQIQNIENEYQQGLITLTEQKRLMNHVWLEVTEKMANLTWDL